jgi:hypothetical protein
MRSKKLAKVFDDEGAEIQANGDAEVTKLHPKIGQLVVERDPCLGRVSEATVRSIRTRSARARLGPARAAASVN